MGDLVTKNPSSSSNDQGFAGSGMRYRPLIALGQGGMADVLLSVAKGPSGFNKLVVLKTMRKELVANQELRQMFLAEARLSARLNNANVVQVHEVLDTALPCIVMEYLEGQPLSTVYEHAGEKLTLPMQIAVLSEALAGLHYSHELKDFDGTPLNLVHRDISPQNIFITYDGVVKVLDFGIAKISDNSNQTQTGVIKGKLSYMPREQLLGGTIDRRADIYSIGCILWHAAAGRKLWANANENEIARALIEGRLQSPSEVRPVDPALEAIVMKALAPEPDDRYPTALAMRRALDQYLSSISPGTNVRDVGELISEVFAEQHAARAHEVRRLLQGGRSEAPPPIPLGIESVIQTTTGNTGTTPDSQKRGWAPWLVVTVLVAGFALAGVMGAFVLHYVKSDAPRATVGSAPPESVQVRLAASPATATISVDGNAVSGNPTRLTFPTDQREHVVRAAAEGYETREQLVRFDRDRTIEIVLTPLAPSPPPVPATATEGEPTRKPGSIAGKKNRPTPTPVNRSQAATRTKAQDCDPPYTFENGIKTYKTGCLTSE